MTDQGFAFERAVCMCVCCIYRSCIVLAMGRGNTLTPTQHNLISGKQHNLHISAVAGWRNFDTFYKYVGDLFRNWQQLDQKCSYFDLSQFQNYHFLLCTESERERELELNSNSDG